MTQQAAFYSRTNHRAYQKQQQNTTQMHLQSLNLPKVKAILARGGKVPAELRGTLSSLSTFYTEVRFYYWMKFDDGRVLLIGENTRPGFNQEENVRVTLATARDIHIAEKVLEFSTSGEMDRGTISTKKLMVVCGYGIDNREIRGKKYSIMPVITRIDCIKLA